MKRILFSIISILILSSVFAQKPWDNGNLKVSPNKKFLQHANGKPFFWQGDTGWLLFQRLDRSEAKKYLDDRADKGFNVVQSIFLQFLADENPYADKPFVGDDLTQFDITPGNNPEIASEYDYWDHVDYIVDYAASKGIYIAIVPVWGQFVKRNEVTPCIAEVYAAKLANRFKDKPNIIWINGGAIQGDMKPEVWNAIGNSLRANDPDRLITYHPFGRTQSSTWFNDAPWLDFNMFASGHRTYEQDNGPKNFGEDNWRYVLDDHSQKNLRPTIDGEPSYESTPHGLHDATQPYWNDNDVRRYAYWSVFAGAMGHTYGTNAVRQFHKVGYGKAASGAKTYWDEALNDPGSFQMQHLKKLMLSRPYFDRVNDQSIVVDEGDKYDRILATRGNDYLMVYNYTGRSFKINMGKISGDKVNGWWFNPRTGEAVKLKTYSNKGIASFTPPGKKTAGNDWVLVLDDASKKYKAPGITD